MERTRTWSGRSNGSRPAARSARDAEVSPVRRRVIEARERARVLAELDAMLREDAFALPAALEEEGRSRGAQPRVTAAKSSANGCGLPTQ